MAATTVDDLQIKIEADAKTASDKLDALAQSMVKLASSLSINVGKMSGVAIGLNSITRASQNLNSRNITTLATAMGKVAGVDSAQISRVAGSMTQLKNSVSGGFNTDMTGIVNVADSLSKLGGIKATQGAQNLVLIKDQLAQFVQGMNSVGTFTFDPTGLTNTIKAIAKLGGKTATQATANLPSISAQLQNFVRQMNQIGSMSFDNKNLTDLVTSIGRLGSVASGRAVNNIPLLANNLKYLFETLSKAPYISQNIIQMTTALANLARTGASSGTAARSLGTSLFSFSKSAGNARNSAFSLAGAIGKFYATYWMVIRGLGLFRNAIDISSDLTEVENVVRTTFGNMEYKVNDFVQNSIQQFGMSELSVKQYASTFQAMGTAMDVGGKQIENANRFLNGATDGYIGLSDSMSDVSLNLTKLTADMASFYDKDQADVAKDLQSVFTGMVVPLRKYGLDLTQATLKEWAMKNGMDADIKSMTQAEKAMLRYQYVLANTTAAQGDFARTADSWANQVRILKQNFQQLGGIIGGALINAFKPFLRTLNFVMQKVISFATTVTNALGAIFGWKFEVSGGGVAEDWSDAASSADDLADSTGKAADNTKKMKNNLHALDELNINNGYDNGTGSGGSGSGAGGAGGASGGKLVQTDTIWKDFESNIKDLYHLGRYISDALSKAMENIDWDSVYEKARNFGTGLADFLNGLITPRLFGNVGKTIAGALNTALEFLNSFGTEFDWENFGKSIASGINRFFTTFNFGLLANTLNTWVRGIETTIASAIKDIKWNKIFDGVTEFFLNLNLDTALLLTVAAIKKLNPEITKLGKRFNSFAKYGNALLGTINGNAEAVGILSSRFPKLSNVIVATTRTFTSFRRATGSTMTATFGAIESGISTLRNSLTAFQKGAIGITSIISEFVLVKDAFYDIASGSENLVRAIGQIAIAAGVAGAALYVAFGPVGLAMAAVTGIAAAIMGIKASIEDAELSTVFTALDSTGTVSMEHLGDVAKTTFSEITSDAESTKKSLDSIAESRESLNETSENIGKLKTAIEMGAYTTGEKIPEIIQQYQSLLESSKNVFNEEYDVIVGNVVGAWKDILVAQGQSVPELVAQLASLRDSGNEAFSGISSDLDSLIEQFNNGSISEQEFLEKATPLIDKISAVNSDGSVDSAANSIRDFGGAMDISQYISNGELDTEAFKGAINSVVTEAQNGKDNLQSIGDESRTSIKDMQDQLNALGIDSSSIDWSALYGASDTQVQHGISDIDSAYEQYANQVQYNLISQLPSVVDQATADYENLGWWQKLFTTREDYVDEAVSTWKDNVIAPATTEIQKGFDELGIDGQTYADEAADKMVSGLFNTVTTTSYEGVQITTRSLKTDWEDILTNALDGASKAIDAENYGKNMVDGFSNGVQSNSSTATNQVSDLMQAIDNAIHDSVLEFGSPSKKTEEYGAWFVEGFNNGIANNTRTTVDAINQWISNISSVLSTEVWANIFNNISRGFQSKWLEFRSIWNSSLNAWWNANVTPWFAVAKWTALGNNMKNGLYYGFKGIVQMIGSVMNGMIDVFNAGLSRIKNAMNNLISDYNSVAGELGVSKLPHVNVATISKVNIPKYEVGGFPEDGLFFANHNEMVGQFSNGKTAVANNEQIVAGIREGVKAAVAEVLAPYLSDIADSNREIAERDASFTVDGRELVKAINEREARNGFSFT